MIDLRKMNGESEIPKKLYLLDSEIDSVHKNVEILIAILEPLLRPMPVSDSRDWEKLLGLLPPFFHEAYQNVV